MFQRALSNPRTTWPAWLGSAALVVGALGTYSGGAWWPLLVGLAVRELGHAVAHANAQDAS